MKKSRITLFASAALVMVLATGALFNYLHERQKETEKQASEALDRGIALYREGQYPESLEILQGIPDGVLQDWHLPYYTASALVMLKKYERAAGKYEEALVINPGKAAILYALGVVYYKLGKLGLSKSYFAAVLEIDPGNEEARGLMDIMAQLERQQPTSAPHTALQDEGVRDSDH